MERDLSWQRATRVLVVRLDSLGDVLMTTPALRAVRQSRPERHVALLTSPAGAAVAALVPEVDEVIAYRAPWMKAADVGDAGETLELVGRLRAGGYDAAIICTVYSQSPLPAAFLCYLAGIPLRLAHCRENPYHLLTDWVVEREPEQVIRHEVQRQLDLVATVGYRTADQRLSLRVPAEARARVLRLLADQRLNPERMWLVIHPGATAPSRRYPLELYARVAHRLTVDYGWQVVFTGGEDERELVQRLRAAMGVPSFSLAGRLGLPELAALIQLAPLLITNNTGPAHIAAAVGTPVVDLYALTNPQHTPWGVPARVLFSDVPCRYCYKSICPQGHHDCLRRVEPDTVVAAAAELVAESGLRRPLIEGQT
jgi:lipopolysaccharide heptosyltransferase II